MATNAAFRAARRSRSTALMLLLLLLLLCVPCCCAVGGVQPCMGRAAAPWDCFKRRAAGEST
jgi:hypothetical protein